jgi:alpha-beta hydrolase superfamily lysophospholipase
MTLFLVGCGDLSQPVNEEVVGGKVVVDLDGKSIKKSLIEKKIPGVDVNTTVYGYKAYKIPYSTTDEEGNSVSVSGLMVVPKGLPDALVSAKGLSMVSDDHGTIFANAEAPDVEAGTNNAPVGSAVILTSLFGFVTLQPDYIGFGDSSEHYHPFVLKKSLANATVDFIIAAKKFAVANNIKLNGQLFLTGYSEGGYAAMATLQKIEQEGNMQVTLAAPMAGPYAFEALAMKVLSVPALSVPSFMADVGYAYAIAYDEDVASVINEPYASKLEGLLDGTKTSPEISAALTTVTTGTDGLFNPQFVNHFFTDPEHWFKKAAQENNLHNWVPQTAVRLVHCKGDDVIPYKISELTQGTMTALGATNVALVPVEETLGLPSLVGHAACGQLAYGVAGTIFAQTRKATVGY